MGSGQSSAQVDYEVKGEKIIITNSVVKYLSSDEELSDAGPHPSEALQRLQAQNDRLRSVVAEQRERVRESERRVEEVEKTIKDHSGEIKQAQQMKQDYEEKLSQLDNEMEKRHQVTQESFDESAAKMKQRFESLVPVSNELPCEEVRRNIQACLTRHRDRPLLCSVESSAFLQCTGLHKQGYWNSRGRTGSSAE